jgi:two-component system LytT family response regulator
VTIRCRIVDDEELARDRIRRFLRAAPDVVVVGEHGDAPEALAAIREEPPELLFLDVQMPDLDGVALLSELAADERAVPATIFTTAYEAHAVRAFDLAAVDYLLKPITAARFAAALDRARERLAARAPGGAERIPVRSVGGIRLVRTAEIEWIEAQDNYVLLHVAGGEEHLVRESLAAVEETLDARRFVRVHRGAVVNLERVRELTPLFAGDWELRLESGARVRMSRTYRARVHARLGAVLGCK